MEKVIIARTPIDTYLIQDYSNAAIELLGAFLTSETSGSSEAWINIILKKEWNSCGGNRTYLRKYNGMISIHNSIVEDDDSFVIAIPQFIEVLDQWDALREKGYKEIVITRDGKGIVILQGIE